jgi:hypothetical protein
MELGYSSWSEQQLEAYVWRSKINHRGTKNYLFSCNNSELKQWSVADLML